MKRIALIACLMCGPASSQVASGNKLQAACTSGGDVQTGYCIGYITGVWEGIKYGSAATMLRSGLPNEGIDEATNTYLDVCLPEGVTSAQSIEIVLEYLNDNPELRHDPARSLIFHALHDAFPCN